MAFLLVKCAAEQQSGSNKLARMKQSLHSFSLSAVVAVQEWISVTSYTDGRELILRVLPKAMSNILFEFDEICLQVFLKRARKTLRLNCFPILEA